MAEPRELVRAQDQIDLTLHQSDPAARRRLGVLHRDGACREAEPHTGEFVDASRQIGQALGFKQVDDGGMGLGLRGVIRPGHGFEAPALPGLPAMGLVDA